MRSHSILILVILPPGHYWVLGHKYSRFLGIDWQFSPAPGHLRILEAFASKATGSVKFFYFLPRGICPKNLLGPRAFVQKVFVDPWLPGGGGYKGIN